jgi:virginiamycin B lyase
MWASGKVTEYTVPTANCIPSSPVAGPDSNIWFAEQTTSRIGHVTPSGNFFSEIVIPGNQEPGGFIFGKNKVIWFQEQDNKVGEITGIL